MLEKRKNIIIILGITTVLVFLFGLTIGKKWMDGRSDEDDHEIVAEAGETIETTEKETNMITVPAGPETDMYIGDDLEAEGDAEVYYKINYGEYGPRTWQEMCYDAHFGSDRVHTDLDTGEEYPFDGDFCPYCAAYYMDEVAPNDMGNTLDWLPVDTSMMPDLTQFSEKGPKSNFLMKCPLFGEEWINDEYDSNGKLISDIPQGIQYIKLECWDNSEIDELDEFLGNNKVHIECNEDFSVEIKIHYGYWIDKEYINTDFDYLGTNIDTNIQWYRHKYIDYGYPSEDNSYYGVVDDSSRNVYTGSISGLDPVTSSRFTINYLFGRNQYTDTTNEEFKEFIDTVFNMLGCICFKYE